MWPAETEVMVSQLCLMCGSTKNCQTLCLGARPRYNLVVDEDVKKPTNQPTWQRVAANNTNLCCRLWGNRCVMSHTTVVDDMICCLINPVRKTETRLFSALGSITWYNIIVTSTITSTMRSASDIAGSVRSELTIRLSLPRATKVNISIKLTWKQVSWRTRYRAYILWWKKTALGDSWGQVLDK